MRRVPPSKPSKRRIDLTDSFPDSINPEELIDIYETMVLARAIDERVWLMNRQGKAAIVASCQGHEAVQIGSVWAASKHPGTTFFPYYRDLGMMVALGVSPLEIMLSFTAKAGERFSGARQFPLHGAIPELNVINLSNVVATQIPQAVGYALGGKLQGNNNISITTFGDGACSEGDFHEGMNFAAIHKLPVIFLCENNKYAISVPLNKQMAIPDIAARGPIYGMPGITIDGTDIFAVYDAIHTAINRALNGDGPTLIDAKVERYLPHTSDDDHTRYRSEEEILEAKKYDPLLLLQKRLIAHNLINEQIIQDINNKTKSTVNKTTEVAEQTPMPSSDDVQDHVYEMK